MRNSKRGSSTVFVLMIMSAMMTIVFTFFMSARNEYIRSRTDAIANISGDSLMSEYNSYVQQEYGLFLLEGKRSELTSGFRKYFDYSMSGIHGVGIDKVGVVCGGYSLTDTGPVRKQIIEHMRFAVTMDILDSVMKEAAEENEMDRETLRNRATIVSLPSYGAAETSLTLMAKNIAVNPGSIQHAFSEKTEGYLINRYIMRYFNNDVHSADNNHFFRDETEYILGGKLSDKENLKAVDRGLKALRFPLNLQHIYSDPAKMKKLLTVAELLTPEAAPATQLVLAAAWAYAESDNDVTLLREGNKVPVVKDKSTWAVDIDNVIDGFTNGVFRPDVEKGYNYEEYLQWLLFFENEDVKVTRIMDLIQINTRMNSDSDFVIKEHCAGINISAKVNGRTFNYEKKY